MIRNDIVRMYREIHSWVGITCGLFLFIAFYAGAISMFEVPLQRWTSAPINNETITPLIRTQELVKAVTAKHPEAAKNYNIILNAGPETPARMHWEQRDGSGDDHAPAVNYYADLTRDGNIVVEKQAPSDVAQLIDTLHQQVGILIDHEMAMPITGVASLLYGLALISGFIILLPTLLKDLFALRFGKKLKRMWLDIHNLLGIFSLPFHLIMALTAVVFAGHDYFYSSQNISIYSGIEAPVAGPPSAKPPTSGAHFYPVTKLLADLNAAAPEFTPEILNYRQGRGPDAGQILLVSGVNPTHHAHRPRHGTVSLNPYTGEILATDYMPGRQEPLQAVLSSFFALHFGNFGGEPTRWLYFVLGLSGAFLFYSGNLLWIEVRRKKSRQHNLQQTRSSRVLGSLTVGVCLGCIAGISATIAGAKLMPSVIMDSLGGYTTLYYLVFLSSVGWALYQGAAKSSVHLLYLCAGFTALIPLASILAWLTSLGWNHKDGTIAVDCVATIGCMALLYVARQTGIRITAGKASSIWSIAEEKTKEANKPRCTSSQYPEATERL